MRRNKLIFVCLLLYGSVFAQDTLRYNTFIKNVKTNYPLISRANNINTIGELTYKSARGGYDPVITSSYDNKFYSGKNYYSLLDAKIKQPLFTSQYLTAGYQYAQGAFVNPENQTSTNGMPFLGVETSLLQGVVIDKRRAEVLKAKNTKLYFEAESRFVTNEVLFTASTSFIDWVYSCKELSLFNYFTNLAQQRLNAIKSLSNAGEYAGIDTVEAAILFQSRYLDTRTIEIENQKISTSVQALHWLDNNRASSLTDKIILVDSLEYYYERSKMQLKLYLTDEVSQNPVLEKYQAYQKVLEVDKRYKAELIKPKLDLSYNFLSGNQINSTAAFNSNNYKWGLNLAFPVFLRSARNDYKISKLNALNNGFELSAKSNELDFKTNVIKKNIEVVIDQIAVAERNVAYSRLLLESEKIKFAAGESSLFLLNTRETKWMETELKLAQYKAKFIKNMIELVYLKGTLNYTL